VACRFDNRPRLSGRALTLMEANTFAAEVVVHEVDTAGNRIRSAFRAHGELRAARNAGVERLALVTGRDVGACDWDAKNRNAQRGQRGASSVRSSTGLRSSPGHWGPTMALDQAFCKRHRPGAKLPRRLRS
jgi:hypothetical protein